jgi:hypothetical protein
MTVGGGRFSLFAVLIALACAGVYAVAPAAAQQSPGDPVEQPVDEKTENNDNCAESEEGDDSENEECAEDAEEAYQDGEAGVGGSPGGGGGEQSRPRSKPRDSSVPKVRRVRVRSISGGHRISFRVSEQVEATLVFERCTIFRPHRCIHWERTDTRIVQKAKRGTNSALVGAGSLPSGRYRVEVHAVDGGHHHSNVGRKVFFVD